MMNLVLARRGHSLRVFKSQTCERAYVCLHIVVVMQALVKLAENVSLYTSDQSACGYFAFLCTWSNTTIILQLTLEPSTALYLHCQNSRIGFRSVVSPECEG